MSASLVGSEMCIRDRRRLGCPPGRHRLAACAMHCAGLQHGGEGCARSRTCLLYTSDAADDM
eukprot:8158077-Alexandrium_andersonii.AAC.1